MNEIVTLIESANADIDAAKAAYRVQMKNCGYMLRQCRNDAGLSLREVARRMGFTPPYVCDVELGRRAPTPSFATEFLKALAIDKRRRQ